MAASYQKFTVAVLVLVSVILYVNSFIIGAPPDTCGNPTTFHTEPLNDSHVGQYLPQDIDKAPYKLFVNARRYENYTFARLKGKEKNAVRITLRAAPGDYFKGFFIQATKSNYSLDRPDRPAYGTFRPVDQNSAPRSCRAAVGVVGGITHTGNTNKTEVSVDWIPPVGCNLGDVQFVATVVRGYSEYWVDIRSDVIQPSGFVRRSLLCELYVDPYNRRLQRRVLQALRELRRRQRQRGPRRG
ncbi:hypothetical protein FSP39_013999 [Pinctada imbricata]|uniref:Reelin domain-containing protein n=1 Tax=Pinctada imbricata TaxID=66713 RepID=A0AA88XSW5_PINIB|nr:hypothetical protein FSP39_013999 [Pinctada imbricata]